MATWEESLVVGTENGHLLIYDVVPRPEDPQKPFSVALRASYKDFSKKQIDQIDIVESAQLLFMLSDGLVTVHSLPSLDQIKAIGKFKPVYFYAVDTTGGVVKLALVLKKRVIVCEWTGVDFTFEKPRDVPDVIKTVVFCGQSLCIGFKRRYSMLDIATGTPNLLFETGKSDPLCTVLPDDQLLLGRDNISVFIGHDGKPTRRYGLSWSETPVAIGCSYPYAIALLPKVVEVQLLFGSLTQTIPLIQGAQCLAVTKSGVVYLSNKLKNGTIWRLSPIDFSVQVDKLIQRTKYQEALLLCENLDDTHISGRERRLDYLRELNAYHSFNQGHYGSAMTTFVQLQLEPLRVLGLYGSLLPACYAGKFTFDIPITELKEGAAFNKALVALGSYLEQKRRELKLTSKTKPVVTEIGYGVVADGTDDNYQVEWNETTSLPQIIDTTLLRVYVATNPALVSHLLTLPNNCHVKECETILESHQRVSELVLLYRGRDLHEKALKLLKRQGTQGKENQLSGTKPSIEYLKTLGKENLNLLLDPEYTHWLFQANPIEALDIYIVVRKPSQLLPAGRVIEHLDSMVEKNVLKEVLVVRYLEFIIHELMDETPEFHNKLVIQYFGIVLDLKRKNKDESSARRVAGTEPGALGKMRTKLLDFLEESKFYSPSVMLSRFNFSEEGLHEERAILLSKIGQHYEALREYVHELHDFVMAEDYCRKHYDPEHEEAKDVYLHLLKVYMTTPLGSDEAFAQELKSAAFVLLDKHYREVNVPKALEKEILPEKTRVRDVYPFFESVLRELNKERRNKQIQLNLQSTECMKVKSELLKLRANVIKITDETYCPFCKHRVGDTAFARYPDGTIVHYKCYMKKEQQAQAATSAVAI